jgi:hypothetical protein
VTGPQPVSFKLRAVHLGAHWHVNVRASEFGTDTTHGLNGTLVFREVEWLAFSRLLIGEGASSSPIEITEVEG